ncbi:CoA transferase [Arthrobacter sp. D1-29]
MTTQNTAPATEPSIGRGRPPLTGRVILDLSGGIAGAYCSKLLSDAGATVVKVEAPEGTALRRWSASRTKIEPGNDGVLFSYLAQGAQSVIIDPDSPQALHLLDALIGLSDAIVWSPGSPIADLRGASAKELRQRHPDSIIASITNFGLEGPWHDRAATEFTLQAWSGAIIGLGRGASDRAPFYVGGQIGEWVSGAYAAVAIMSSWAEKKVTGQGSLIDHSILEALTLCLTYYPVTFLEVMGRPWRDSRTLVVPGVSQAKDGLIGIACGTLQQRNDLYVMVDHPEWIIDDALMTRQDEVSAIFNDWIAERTVAEVRELASAFRIPHAPVGNGATIPESDHFRARNVFVDSPDGRFVQPRPSYRPSSFTLREPTLAPALGADTEYWLSRAKLPTARSSQAADGSTALPFAGLRVLDLTAFWAGPSCTHALALMGAEVIHLESTRRPDGGRLVAGVREGGPWWEHSPIHLGGNAGKKSVTINFQTDEGRDLLRELVATADVLVENFTPRVLDHAGFGFDALREINPRLIMLRMPGFGLEGPWRDVPAFAYAIEDGGALTWLTGYEDQKPVEPYCIGDPNAGVHALFALLVALENREQTGEGALVEAAMIDAAVNLAAEQFLEYSANGILLTRAGNKGPVSAPQNLYPTSEIDEFGRHDVWIALAVSNDGQWQALRTALGDPSWAQDPTFSTAAGRHAAHKVIDEALTAWCETQTAADIVDLLWPAGVPVARVMQPHRQIEIPQYEARQFFEVVDHPVVGTFHQSTLPFRWSSRPDQLTLKSAPLLGEDNDSVFASLGITETKLAELEALDVIGRAPASA